MATPENQGAATAAPANNSNAALNNGNNPTTKKRRKKKKISSGQGNSLANANPSTSLGNSSTSQKSKRRNRRQKQQQQQQQQQPSSTNNPTIHLPHAKITFRNISHVEKHGSLEKMVELIKTVVQDQNNESLSDVKADSSNPSDTVMMLPPVKIVLDEGSIARALEAEKKVEDTADEKDTTAEIANVSDLSEEQKKASEFIMKQKEKEDREKQEEEKNKKEEKDENVISARFLYAVPPRKSRRRGEISGHAYLVLYPPMPIFIQEKLKAAKEAAKLAAIAEEEKQKEESLAREEEALTKEEAFPKEEQVLKEEPVPTEGAVLVPKEEPVSTEEEVTSNKEEPVPKEESVPKEEPVPTENDATLDENMASPEPPTTEPPSTTDTTTAPATQEQKSENTLTAEPKPGTESKAPAPAPVITSAERSTALAQSRLLLQQTITSISKMCELDSKKDQNYRGLKVETSENQKIWKDQSEKKGGYGFFQKKYDSTIEQSDDFKKFMERIAKDKEERLNRPKPPPGGGPLATETSGSTEGKDVSENGQPISALVLHLREKNKVSKSKKDAKKSVKDAQKKLKKSTSATQGRGKASENTGSTMTSSKAEGLKRNRKKRQGGNKKGGKNRNQVSTDPSPFPGMGPAMILTKPGMK